MRVDNVFIYEIYVQGKHEKRCWNIRCPYEKKIAKKNLTGFSEEEEFVALRHKKSVEA